MTHPSPLSPGGMTSAAVMPAVSYAACLLNNWQPGSKVNRRPSDVTALTTPWHGPSPAPGPAGPKPEPQQ